MLVHTNDQIAPGVIGEQLKSEMAAKISATHLAMDPEEKFDVRINRRERNENSEVNRGGTGNPGAFPESPESSAAGGTSKKA